MKRLISLILSLSLALSLFLSLAACGKSDGRDDGIMPTKAELAESIEKPTDSLARVCDYLVFWGIEPFHRSKLISLESLYAQRFSGELPKTDEMAKTTAEYFLEYFYDEIDLTDSTAVTDALITCYVAATGDPYSAYRTADQHVDYETDMSGSFVGVGITVQYINYQILVITVYDDSPAERAGIREGDIIVAVDGVSVEELGYEQAIDNVRGEEGTNVTVTVLRGGERVDCVATRAPITEISVSYELTSDRIGYIRITSFKANTDEQFTEAINYMESNGAIAIIFDLRSNGGGYIRTATNMVDRLIPAGVNIISFGSYAQPIKTESERSISVPIAILTNEYTASAAEIFVAALRDYSSEEMGKLIDCTIVGATTFGKGVAQSTFPFTDNSSVTLTVSHFYSPLGKSHNSVGIEPDIEVSLGEEGDSQYERAYSELLGKCE